jgi:ketosteroid isomerase-like protein
MKSSHPLVLAAGLGALFAAGQAAAAPLSTAESNAIIAAVKAIEVKWNEDIKTHDPATFASYYSVDATVMNPFAPVDHGRAAVEADMKAAFADPNFALSFAPDDAGVSPDGSMAWTQGHCQTGQTDPTTHAKAVSTCSYLTLYRQDESGAWKAFEDISTPTPAPKG